MFRCTPAIPHRLIHGFKILHFVPCAASLCRIVSSAGLQIPRSGRVFSISYDYKIVTFSKYLYINFILLFRYICCQFYLINYFSKITFEFTRPAKYVDCYLKCGSNKILKVRNTLDLNLTIG